MDFDQVAVNTDFDANPEDRCPVVLLLDNSASMTGAPLDALNDGLRLFRDSLSQDPLARKRVEVAVVSFGPVSVVSDFQTVDTFEPPRLAPASDTPMGAAIVKGLDLIESRKQAYRDNGIKYYRPWIFLITDGAPTDDWAEAARRVHEGVERKRLVFFAVGVAGANMTTLTSISPREPRKLDGLNFRELFVWLSNSLRAVSGSRPEDDRVALPRTDDWSST